MEIFLKAHLRSVHSDSGGKKRWETKKKKDFLFVSDKKSIDVTDYKRTFIFLLQVFSNAISLEEPEGIMPDLDQIIYPSLNPWQITTAV